MLVSNNRIVALTAESMAPTVKLPSLPREPALPKSPTPAPAPMTGSTQATSEPASTIAAPISATQPGQPSLAINTPPAQPIITPSAQPVIADRGSRPDPVSTANATAAKASPASVSSTGTGNPQTASAAKESAQTRQLSADVVDSHPVPASSAVLLAVKVGSFTVKSNADALVVSLNDLGYRPVVSQFEDTHGRQWYLVKLGPYKRWNAASVVAARVAIAENVRPIIGPMQ